MRASREDSGSSVHDGLEINFVRLEGSVGCVENGAGLAMATLALLVDQGLAAANFMDIRPVASHEQVAEGFRLLLGDPKVKVILVNIFGAGKGGQRHLGLPIFDSVAEAKAETAAEASLDLCHQRMPLLP